MRNDRNYDQFDDDAIPIKRRTRPANPATARRPAQSRQLPPRQTAARRAPASEVRPARPAREPSSAAQRSQRPEYVRAQPVRTVRPSRSRAPQKRPAAPAKEKKRFGAFAKGFLIYLGVLLVLATVFLIYVHGLLSDFEGSQIDNVIASKLSDIKFAASKGQIEKELTLDTIKEKFSPTEAELKDYQNAFSVGELTYKKARNGLSADTVSYLIYLNGFKVGSIEAKSVKEETVLAIFPVTEWEILSCSADVFSFDFPSTVTVSSGGSVIEGKASDTEGLYSYSVASLFHKDTVITDSAGNSASFNGKDPISFVNYTAKIFSNYRIYSGEKMIDPTSAKISEINDYKYVKEYCDDIPELATYELCLIDKGNEFKVKDENGAEVEFTKKDTLIEAHTMQKSDTMPQDLPGNPDPITVGKTWSMFMTQDLTGPNNGFEKLAVYLIKGSYLYDSMWKYANGIDITFTSDHTYQFQTEELSDYVKFSDECFSCHIKIDKLMNMSNGVQKVDTIDSTFYFVYIDDSNDGVNNPHWAVADRQ
ncbi:MAG: hypothetical protein IKN38_08180 [Clostridia bacterium]|nr:hypothetical protein [Clostridia bacterium]